MPTYEEILLNWDSYIASQSHKKSIIYWDEKDNPQNIREFTSGKKNKLKALSNGKFIEIIKEYVKISTNVEGYKILEEYFKKESDKIALFTVLAFDPTVHQVPPLQYSDNIFIESIHEHHEDLLKMFAKYKFPFFAVKSLNGPGYDLVSMAILYGNYKSANFLLSLDYEEIDQQGRTNGINIALLRLCRYGHYIGESSATVNNSNYIKTAKNDIKTLIPLMQYTLLQKPRPIFDGEYFYFMKMDHQVKDGYSDTRLESLVIATLSLGIPLTEILGSPLSISELYRGKYINIGDNTIYDIALHRLILERKLKREEETKDKAEVNGEAEEEVKGGSENSKQTVEVEGPLRAINDPTELIITLKPALEQEPGNNDLTVDTSFKGNQLQSILSHGEEYDEYSAVFYEKVKSYCPLPPELKEKIDFTKPVPEYFNQHQLLKEGNERLIEISKTRTRLAKIAELEEKKSEIQKQIANLSEQAEQLSEEIEQLKHGETAPNQTTPTTSQRPQKPQAAPADAESEFYTTDAAESQEKSNTANQNYIPQGREVS